MESHSQSSIGNNYSDSQYESPWHRGKIFAEMDSNRSNLSNDSEIIFSEGHSEPMEYRIDWKILPEGSGREKMKTFNEFSSAHEQLSMKVKRFTMLFKYFDDESLKGELATLIDSSEELIKSIKSMAATLNVKKNGCIDDDNDAGNKVGDVVDNEINGKSNQIVGKAKIEKLDIDEHVADAVVDAHRINSNSKKRWLASSEEEKYDSDESSSDIVKTTRRKKRKLISVSSIDQSAQRKRKKNVLLDSTDDEGNDPVAPQAEPHQCGLDKTVETMTMDMIKVKQEKNESDGQSVEKEKKVSECDTDKEIDHLLNFSNIASRTRPITKYNPVHKVPSIRRSKTKSKLIDHLSSASQDIFSSESSTEEEQEEVITEEQYALQLAKQKCLDSSDSDDCDSMDESIDDDSSESSTDESTKTEKELAVNIKKEPSIDLNLSSDPDGNKDSNAIESGSDSDWEKVGIAMFESKNSSKAIKKKLKFNFNLSSDSDLEVDVAPINYDSADDKPKKIRQMLRDDQLAVNTKKAEKDEIDRLKRLEKKNARLTQIVESQTEKLSQSNDLSDVVLDFDTERNSAIAVHPEIAKHLKEHQIAGVKFMYDSCYGSVDSINQHSGSGCILAHCMGLGKTLQLIALLHTVIRYPQLNTKKILVICPKSTIMNWADEIHNWLRSVQAKLKVFHFSDMSDLKKKLNVLREWHSLKAKPGGRAGLMLIGYEAFRSLVFYTDKTKKRMSPAEVDRIEKAVTEYLLKPGADLVVCDEGHVIKNQKAAISRAVNQISSPRRIILTGTPIQNNLKEYYSMVNFIKPSFLGTVREFANRYENPIKNGQHKDSSKADIRIMKQRSYVLHKKLSQFVQRRESAVLKSFLPEKYEYVLFIPMTELQNRLYKHFLDTGNPLMNDFRGKNLIPNYTLLRKIWTHPKVLESAWQKATELRDKKKSASKKLVMNMDEEPDDVLDNQMGKMSVDNDWWREFLEPQDLRSLLSSNKLRVLFEILKLCEENGEKCLVFSSFVSVLDVVEFFMEQIHNKTGNDLGVDDFHGPWQKDYNYFRLDGKTSKTLRHDMIKRFNNPANTQVKCFLISAKAGGQGINLVGANRVILLDTSWNPSSDQQNIFRVFRLGQKRKCYIYRLLAMGTMEEKVYSRSVTKQAMSFRVVDEQQIDRHYSLAELAELYTLTIPDPNAQPLPVRPVDNVLANLLRNHLVYKYHEHDSLLENNAAEDLNDEEKADAWNAYEMEVNMKNEIANVNVTSANPDATGLYTNTIDPAFASMSQMLSNLNQFDGMESYVPQMIDWPLSLTTNSQNNSTIASSNYNRPSNQPHSMIVNSKVYRPNSVAPPAFSRLDPLGTVRNANYTIAQYMPSSSSNGQAKDIFGNLSNSLSSARNADHTYEKYVPSNSLLSARNADHTYEKYVPSNSLLSARNADHTYEKYVPLSSSAVRQTMETVTKIHDTAANFYDCN